MVIFFSNIKCVQIVHMAVDLVSRPDPTRVPWFTHPRYSCLFFSEYIPLKQRFYYVPCVVPKLPFQDI
jgi:hypothetical protein